LYEVHAGVRCDLQGGWANHTELKPESCCANRDSVTSDLLALFGSTEDVNKINLLACWE
jgi:hypothetical protein